MVEYFDLSFCRQDFHHELEFGNVEEGGNEECEDDGNVGRSSHYTENQVSTRGPKNVNGRVALPPGRFGSIPKILGQNMSGQPKMCPDSSRCVQTVQDMSRQLQMFLDSSKCVQTAQNVSGKFKMCPDNSNYPQRAQNVSRQLNLSKKL